MPPGDSAGILLKITGDSSGAVGATKDTTAAIKETDKAASGLKASFTSLNTISTAIGTTIGLVAHQIGEALVDGLVEAAKSTYELSKRFSELGVQIDHARERTGLSVQTLSGLKVAVESVGGSFDTLQTGIVFFEKKIADAAAGVKRATFDITALGLKPVDAVNDLEGSFRKVLAKIDELPPGVLKTNAAIEAFGAQIGPKLIPLIEEYNGNVDEMIDKAKKLGLVLSGDDVAAAKAFEQSTQQMHETLQGFQNYLGREFIREFNRVFADFNDTLKNNPKAVEQWADKIGDIFHNLVLSIRKEINDLQGYYVAIEGFLGTRTFEQIREDTAKYRVFDQQVENELKYGTLPRNFNPQEDELADRSKLPFGGGSLPEKEAKAKKAAKEHLPKFDFSNEIRDYQKALRALSPELRDKILDAAEKYDIPTALAFAQLFTESSFNTRAVSPKGAVGIGQLLPSTAGKTKDQLFNVDTNLAAWGKEMSRLFAKYGDWSLASLAYIGGDKTAAAYLRAEATGETALVGFAKGNPQSAKYPQKIAALSGLSKKDLAGTIDPAKEREKELKERKALEEEVFKYATKLADEEHKHNIELFRKESEERIATLNAAFEEGSITATDHLEQVGQIKIDQLKQQFDLSEPLDRSLKTLTDLNDINKESDERTNLRLEINKQLLENYIDQVKNTKDLRKALQDVIEEEQDRFKLAVERNSAAVSGDLPGQLQFNPDSGQFELLEKMAELTDAQIRRQEELAQANAHLSDSWNALSDSMANAGNTQMAQIDISQQGLNLVDSMTDALENAIERWLLYGESVGKALKQALAAELAHVAARCAIKAIEATADGFFFLATGQFAAATAAFTAAAYYAAVAVGAGLAAKALAPKQQAKPAGGAAGAAARSGTGGSSGESGQIYSQKYGDDATILNVNRNAPETVKHEVIIHIPEGVIAKHVANNINKNGSLRLVFRDLAAQG